MYVYTDPGFIFVCTKYGYDKTPEPVKCERAPGKPIKGFEYYAPASWMKKGYIETVREEKP